MILLSYKKIKVCKTEKAFEKAFSVILFY